MIRGTKNEGFMSQSKDKTIEPALNYTGIKSESYELVDSSLGIGEAREIDTRKGGQTTTPSNWFNGKFE